MQKRQPIQLIRSRTDREELDYPYLLSCLKEYSAPRDVITRLLRQGDLIRIKKGLYVFGEHHRRRLLRLEVLANQIYGPSYVSREYALQHYNLLPEGVSEITCMTTKKNKLFETPLGRFSYQYLHVDKFATGLTLIRYSDQSCAFIATPEKALADYIYSRREKVLDSDELLKILREDYRMDEGQLYSLDHAMLKKIAHVYKNPTIDLLPNLIKRGKHASE